MSKSLKKINKGLSLANEAAQLGSALGQLIGAATKKKKASQKAVKPTKNKKKKGGGMSNNMSVATYAAPANVGRILTQHQLKHRPFDLDVSCAAFEIIWVQDQSQFYFRALGGQSAFTSYCWINPDDIPSPFGRLCSQVGQLFTKWRLLAGAYDYEPYVGTSTAGAFTLACLKDPGVDPTSTQYLNNIDWPESQSGPVWLARTLRLTRETAALGTELFVKEPAPVNDAGDIRQASAGILSISTRAAHSNIGPGGLTAVGVLRVRARIQFTSLANIAVKTDPAVKSLPFPTVAEAYPEDVRLVPASSSPANPAGQAPSPEIEAAARQLLSKMQLQADVGTSASSTPSLVSGPTTGVATPAQAGWFQATQRYAGLETR